MNEEIHINKKVIIPAHEIQFRFSRSSGPGGQNVNKLSTKVSLIFDLAHSSAIDETTRHLLMHKLASEINSAGKITITSQESRSQYANRLIALEKFVGLMRKALIVPKIRRETKPSRSAVTKRLSGKNKRGVQKKLRSKRIDIE
ncbi:MAG: alternative ribosome rescue aminoacyl-tRNA hydrolase ArfB [Ignavibacteriales bacterium]|nr:alternative ribosome rescue aminoacyl-tRNA hydrolase ArfB [Ignavibacteriales bacterium]